MSKVYIVITDRFRLYNAALCDGDDIMVTTSKKKAEILKMLYSTDRKSYDIIELDTNEHNAEIEKYKKEGCKKYWDVTVCPVSSNVHKHDHIEVSEASPYCIKPDRLFNHSDFSEYGGLNYITVYGVEAETAEEAKEKAVKKVKEHVKNNFNKWVGFFSHYEKDVEE